MEFIIDYLNCKSGERSELAGREFESLKKKLNGENNLEVLDSIFKNSHSSDITQSPQLRQLCGDLMPMPSSFTRTAAFTCNDFNSRSV